METQVLPVFGGRVLPFDITATQTYAALMATARMSSIPVGVADAFIAAIAKANGLLLASRDKKPFAGLGLQVIDPWA